MKWSENSFAFFPGMASNCCPSAVVQVTSFLILSPSKNKVLQNKHTKVTTVQISWFPTGDIKHQVMQLEERLSLVQQRMPTEFNLSDIESELTTGDV